MKKAFCLWTLCFALMFTGCGGKLPQAAPESASSASTGSSAPAQQETSASQAQRHGTAVFGQAGASYYAAYASQHIVLPGGDRLPVPSAIRLFVGDACDEIVFLYEYCIDLAQENDADTLPKDAYGNTQLYTGKVSQISETVYGVSTLAVVSDWSFLARGQAQGNESTADFYVVLEDEKMYLVFEDLTPEALKKYSAADYFTQSLSEVSADLSYTPD